MPRLELSAAELLQAGYEPPPLVKAASASSSATTAAAPGVKKKKLNDVPFAPVQRSGVHWFPSFCNEMVLRPEINVVQNIPVVNVPPADSAPSDAPKKPAGKKTGGKRGKAVEVLAVETEKQKNAAVVVPVIYSGDAPSESWCQLVLRPLSVLNPFFVCDADEKRKQIQQQESRQQSNRKKKPASKSTTVRRQRGNEDDGEDRMELLLTRAELDKSLKFLES